MSRIQLLDYSRSDINQKTDHDAIICQHDVIFRFFNVVFLLSSLVTSLSFLSISWPILELWQFFCKGLTRNPEIRNTPSEFCPISGDWTKLGIPGVVLGQNCARFSNAVLNDLVFSKIYFIKSIVNMLWTLGPILNFLCPILNFL